MNQIQKQSLENNRNSNLENNRNSKNNRNSIQLTESPNSKANFRKLAQNPSCTKKM